MRQYVILAVLALVIWWFFFRSKPKTGMPAAQQRQQYLDEDGKFCTANKEECEDFVARHVSFEGGPEAFRKIHDHIHHQYDHTVAGIFHMNDKFTQQSMNDYVKTLDEVPDLYVKEMSELYKKYTIPESIRNKHMAMINSQHERRLQKEQKWFKIFEPFINK